MSVITIMEWLVLFYLFFSVSIFASAILLCSENAEKKLAHSALNCGISVCVHAMWEFIKVFLESTVTWGTLLFAGIEFLFAGVLLLLAVQICRATDCPADKDSGPEDASCKQSIAAGIELQENEISTQANKTQS